PSCRACSSCSCRWCRSGRCRPRRSGGSCRAWKPWSVTPQIFSPRARRSARTASMPFLSMVRRAAVETRSFTQRFSEATQKRRSCRLGRKRRRVLLLACETLLPVCTLLPVTWQTRDIRTSKGLVSPIARETGAPRPGPGGLAEGDAGKEFDCAGGAGSRSGPDPATAGRSEPPIMRGQVVDCNRKGKGGKGVGGRGSESLFLPATYLRPATPGEKGGRGSESLFLPATYLRPATPGEK